MFPFTIKNIQHPKLWHDSPTLFLSLGLNLLYKYVLFLIKNILDWFYYVSQITKLYLYTDLLLSSTTGLIRTINWFQSGYKM